MARDAVGRGFDVVGVMTYEAQIAGLPDLSSPVVLMKRASARELSRRRGQVVAAVRDVVGELADHAARGTVIAIHSTIEPNTAADLAEQLQPKGIHIVDAPVSGGAGAADKGELAVMVGASDEAYELVKPVFKKWASMVVRAGEPGAGTRMKLARNMLTFIGFAAACEAQRLAEASGIDLQKLGRVVRHSDAQSGGPGAIMVRDDTKELTPDHWIYDMFVHTRGLAEKDLTLALGLGETVGVDLPLAEVALARLADGLGVPHTKE